MRVLIVLAAVAALLFVTLVDRDDIAGLSPAVAKFADGEVKLLPRERHVGNSGDRVFVVTDRTTGAKKGVVKVYADKGRFDAAVEALHRFDSFGLTKSTHPQLLATGSLSERGCDYSLLYMSFVAGRPFREVMYDSEAAPVAARALGLALVELHGHRSGKQIEIPNSYRDDLLDKQRYLPDDAQYLAAEVLKAIEGRTVPAVAIHGDVALKNVFFDSATGQLGFIDLGGPLSYAWAERDYTQAEQAILSLDRKRLTPAQYDAIVLAFRDAYDGALDHDVYTFFRLRRCCDRLRDYELHHRRWKNAAEEANTTARRDSALDFVSELAARNLRASAAR